MKRFFTAFFMMLFAFGLIYAQAPNIILLTPDDRDDDQYEFLLNQGFNVTKLWGTDDPEASWSIAAAGQDTIDMLNAADLIIIGRSPQSGNFEDPADVAVYNGLTPPLIVNSAFLARSSRLKMFNSTTFKNLTEQPLLGYGVATDPMDPVFTNVTLSGDSLLWWTGTNTIIDNADEANNGTIMAMYNKTVPLVARWNAGTEYYPGAGEVPAGPRVYFGMGSDAGGDVNFFPLTKAAQAIYLAEIQTLLGLPLTKPVFLPEDQEIILLTPDDRDDDQYEFLVNQGFNVTKFWGTDDPEASWSIASAGQDTIDILNTADLIIIGRSPQSGNFEDPADVAVYNGLLPPLIVNSAFLARSSRLKMFNSTSFSNLTDPPLLGYGVASDPSDPVFTNATLSGDSLLWWTGTNTIIDNLDEVSNGTIVAMYNKTIPLLARWDAGTEYYPGAGEIPAGPRVYFGMGSDAGGAVNFFPLTRAAQSVYLAEIQTLLGVTVTKPVYKVEDQSIIMLTPDDRDDDQYEFLLNQGFNVTKLWGTDDPEASWSIAAAGQDTIDILNAADLIIIGRSPQSGNFEDPADVAVYNGLIPPVVINSAFLARSSRLKMFNSTAISNLTDDPVIGYGVTSDPADPAFANVTLSGDSLAWWSGSNTIIDNAGEANNGTIVAMYNKTIPLLARWNAGSEYYPGAGEIPAGPRVYFGMGSDAGGAVNFFPLTKAAQTVYLAEIQALLGVPVTKPVFKIEDQSIILLTPDDRDDDQYEFLVNQGFNVTKLWGTDDPEVAWSIAAAGQDTIDILNAADLIIIGRSPQSGNFEDPADVAVYNGLIPPVVINSAFLARSSRLKMFNSTAISNLTDDPVTGYGLTTDPTDPVFANVTLDGDSLAWWSGPNTIIDNADAANNGTIVAMYNKTIPLLARWDAGTEFYPGAGEIPAGDRVYFGMGSDAGGNVNFFPLTRDAQIVYVAEISRLLGIEAPEIKISLSDFNVILLSPDDRDDPQMNWLVKNGLSVTKFWGNNDPEATWSIAAAGQDTIDMLNAADLIIIGRSPQSGNFEDPADVSIWNGLTPPVIINSPFLGRSSRLKMFNTTSVRNLDNAPTVGYGVASDPMDPAFTNVTLVGDSLAWWLAPSTILDNEDAANNGTTVAMYNKTIPLLTRWSAGTEYYPGAGVAPAGNRVYFGMGSDAVDPNNPNFFPLTDAGQQVYLNEIFNMLGVEMVEVIPASTDATLASLEYDVATATLTPAFDPGTLSYDLQLPENTNVIVLTATATSDVATVTGGGTIDVSSGNAVMRIIEVKAESGLVCKYYVRVIPFETGFETTEAVSSGIKLYPNPAVDMLYVESTKSISNICVINMLGSVVIEQSGIQENRVQLNIEELSPGLYMIKINNDSDRSVTRFLKK